MTASLAVQPLFLVSPLSPQYMRVVILTLWVRDWLRFYPRNRVFYYSERKMYL